MFRKIIFGFIILAAFSSCLKDSNSCSYDPCSKVAGANEVQAVQNYLTAQGITGTTQHCSGMFYKIELAGSGTAPTVCSNISVTYEGKLADGTVFDAATAPTTPFLLDQTITGWKNGLPLIKTGGRIYLYIPPSLGYGSTGSGPIPPNSILIFKVDLVAVQ
jgi:FKBP-type peptidyl-prolyl cis-trans isomerase FkpA